MTPTGKPVYSDGLVHVKAQKCETCVFHPGNRMHLKPGRLKDIVDHNRSNGAALTCHDTTFGQADQEAICRGYFDAYGDDPTLALAKAMGLIEEVD